jgi:hypothetical protein
MQLFTFIALLIALTNTLRIIVDFIKKQCDGSVEEKYKAGISAHKEIIGSIGEQNLQKTTKKYYGKLVVGEWSWGKVLIAPYVAFGVVIFGLSIYVLFLNDPTKVGTLSPECAYILSWNHFRIILFVVLFIDIFSLILARIAYKTLIEGFEGLKADSKTAAAARQKKEMELQKNNNDNQPLQNTPKKT